MRRAVLAIFFFSLPLISMAQCSMCKRLLRVLMVVDLVLDWNYGILYLMIFPYLIIGGIAYRLYRAKKAN